MSANFYNENAIALAQQYLAKSFAEVHQSWSHFLPSIIENPNARILDLGAGAGRDAKYLAELAQQRHGENNNVQLYAVEPATKITLSELELNLDNTSIDDVFEALIMQRGRLKEMQQLKEW